MRLMIELVIDENAKRDEVEAALREAGKLAGKRVLDFGEPSQGKFCMLHVEIACVDMAIFRNVSK